MASRSCAFVTQVRVCDRQRTTSRSRSVRRAAIRPNLPGRRYGSRVIHWRSAVVREVLPSWPGVVALVVDMDRPVAGGAELRVRALAYVDLVGEPVPGDRV